MFTCETSKARDLEAEVLGALGNLLKNGPKYPRLPCVDMKCEEPIEWRTKISDGLVNALMSDGNRKKRNATNIQ